MSSALISLLAASFAFVGTHFALSHPLRAPLVRAIGEGPFRGLYSLVAAGTMAWMYLAFKDAGGQPPLWGAFGDAVWILASAITFAAMVLLAGSFIGNPALPAPGAKRAAQSEARGVFTITRHPMMWAFALWAIGHMIAAPTPRTLVIALAILILALVGAHMQDRKKQELMGEAWAGWQSRTSYWPKFGRIFQAGAVAWIGGIALWLGLTWLHRPLGGWDAGLWRWIG